jgi:hypothetical protein
MKVVSMVAALVESMVESMVERKVAEMADSSGSPTAATWVALMVEKLVVP